MLQQSLKQGGRSDSTLETFPLWMPASVPASLLMQKFLEVISAKKPLHI